MSLIDEKKAEQGIYVLKDSVTPPMGQPVAAKKIRYGWLIAFFAVFILFFPLLLVTFYAVSVEDVLERPAISVNADSDNSNVALRDVDYEGVLYDYIRWYRDNDYIYYTEPEAQKATGYTGDANLYEFADYISEDTAYTVSRYDWAFANDDGWYDQDDFVLPHNVYISGEAVSVSDTGLESETDINDLLFDMTSYITDMYDYYKDSLNTGESLYLRAHEYVAYMDSEVLSVLIEYESYLVNDLGEESEVQYRNGVSLASLNINMKTGEIIDAADIFTIDDKFVDDYIYECKEQFDVLITENMPRDYLLELFTNGELVWAYTPLGIEYGVAYDNFEGYCTYTCKDRDKYLKSR